MAKELKEEWEAQGVRQLANTEMAQILSNRAEFKAKGVQISRLFK